MTNMEIDKIVVNTNDGDVQGPLPTPASRYSPQQFLGADPDL